MKTSEITKLLNKAGCYVVRHGSRHDLWFSPITGKIFPDTQAKKFLPVLHEVLKKMRGFNPRAFLIPIHVSMTFDYIKIMRI